MDVSLKKHTRGSKGEMLREEVTERGRQGERGQRVTICPNGAAFCNAFPPDYTNDQFEAA